ncbi:MAG: siphovirus Gp157 family protein [Bacteroidota bacterium]
MENTLYDITRDLVLLKDFDAPEQADGDFNQEALDQLRQALDNLNMKFLDKVTNIVKLIKNLEVYSDALSCEAKRLVARKKAFENRVEWLKHYVKTAIEATQTDKVKYSLFTIYVGKSQPSVEVVDLNQIDEQFIRIKKEVDKTKILEQVKATGVIPAGVKIVQGTHLVIR